MTLSDISYDALKIAQRNSVIVESFGDSQKSNIKTIQSDLFEKIEEKFDIIVSNPPYIETKTIQTLDKEVQMEPKLALDGGEDGLDLYRRIIKEAYKYLNSNGILALEIGYNQKDKVINLIEISNKYEDIYAKKDLSKNDRIVVCRKNCQKSIE